MNKMELKKESRYEAKNLLMDFKMDLITIHMEEDIREQVHSELANCSELDFLARYCELYFEKHGQDFVIS